MELFVVVLILLMSIGFSNILSRFIPHIPIPLIQIVLGIIIAILPLGIDLPLEPELFLVLFIAPLLFNDGKLTSRDKLWHLRIPILLLALGLVFVTVFIVGHFIHIMIPSITLPAAFALAAILSPTDAVSVQALCKKIHLPGNIMHLLEGEALINDASGLVAFKFAVAATVTGVFSLTEATVSFFIISIGGLLSGAIISFIIIKLQRSIRRLGMEDVTIQVLIQILSPFLIYLISEELGVSGILAVVAGGLVHSIEHDYTESYTPKLQIVSTSVWSMIIFILNGLVFLILGLQIPNITKIIYKDEKFNNLQVLGYITAISLLLIAIRFIWVYIFGEVKFTLNKKEFFKKSRFKFSLLTSCLGVRGAVTLAGALSIPYVIQDGTPFPQRNLIIFISAGVILFTLIEASIMIPLLLKKDKQVNKVQKYNLKQRALIKIIHASIKVLRKEMNDENKKATMHVISKYNRLIRDIYKNNSNLDLQSSEMKKNIYIEALEFQKKEIEHLLETKQISKEVFCEILETLNYTETILSNRIKHRIILAISIIKRIVSKLFASYKSSNTANIKAIELAQLTAAKAAIYHIQNQINDKNRSASLEVISIFNEIIEKIQIHNSPKNNEQFNELKIKIHLKAIEVQRQQVQLLFENGEINREIANKLRKFINYWEASLM